MEVKDFFDKYSVVELLDVSVLGDNGESVCDLCDLPHENCDDNETSCGDFSKCPLPYLCYFKKQK